jgi:hypothetical protein
LRNDVNVPSKSNKQKELRKQLFFVAFLKATDENSRIQIRWSEVLIRIRTKMSRIRNTGLNCTDVNAHNTKLFSVVNRYGTYPQNSQYKKAKISLHCTSFFLHLVGGSGPEVARVGNPRGWVQYSSRPADSQCPQCRVPGWIKKFIRNAPLFRIRIGPGLSLVRKDLELPCLELRRAL